MSSYFIQVDRDSMQHSITGNYFVGPASEDHITIGRNGVVIKGLFAMSIDEASRVGVLALTTPRYSRWKRVLAAVARWLLKRAA
jgi:hypothetical protein